eukprot:gnl/TRDRNA2_/TRDRNA2_86866_c0_seq2.p1 gnl/TRDRNA2_/TRDRNA2_86866_c0~~gnl/TRDRNA2_/TRDRNA2_86866_c0_seq2.p1  ORF type:complete len:215 (-),score=31.20 gnl/TRDRNA2_/TRDRNA2_86866_c0_seq2:89-733(-)
MRALTLALASLGLALSARIKSSHVPNQQCALNDLQNASEASKVKAMNTTAPVEVNVGEPEVLEVNAVSLWAMMEAKQRNILVTFYHPQCPYCRDFLMRGEDGTRESAPLEVLNRDLQDEVNRPDVVKYDLSKQSPPSDFTVEYVPCIYLVKTDGDKNLFEGDYTNYPELKAFALDRPYEASSFLLRRARSAVPTGSADNHNAATTARAVMQVPN